MVRINLLALCFAAVALLGGIPQMGSGCALLEINTGTCVSGTFGEGVVNLDGSQTGADPATGGSSSDEPAVRIADCANPASTICARPFIATVTAPITLVDIAEFRPAPAVDHGEPNGWTIAGLDTNFYATGGGQVIDGTLLGQPAAVRFTPVSWHWSYGDGAAASRPFPGGGWAAQGIPEFDPTGTSHVYASYGTYYIDLDVDLAAEYRFAGGPWVEIQGVLRVPANQLVITVGHAKTVLVERECTRNPAGPGC